MSRAKPVKAWNVHKGDRVATTNGMREVLEANARLIAAAPDLLAACELTLAHLTSAAHRETKIIPPVLAALRASIAKATGGDL